MSKASNKQIHQSHLLGDLGGRDVWEFINDKLSANTNVMLLYVLDSEGSSPGRKGFKMAVSAEGDLCGTIGGGIMEFKFVEKAKSGLQTGAKDISVVKQFHDKTHDKNQSGMICSGSQLIVLIPLNSGDGNEAIKQITNAQRNNENKTIHISPRGINITDEPAKGLDYKTETEWTYTELIIHKPVIHIIGGGHVGLALTELMNYLGFYVKLYDDRNGLNTIQQNLFADEKHFIDYNTIGEHVNSSKDDFVVMMTIGYRTDKIVLKQLLNKDFFYMGVLGSEKKNERLFEELRNEGIDAAKLSKIFAPVGVNIFSKTTREIAVSIAAEIIFERNKNLPTGRTKHTDEIKPV